MRKLRIKYCTHAQLPYVYVHTCVSTLHKRSESYTAGIINETINVSFFMFFIYFDTFDKLLYCLFLSLLNK